MPLCFLLQLHSETTLICASVLLVICYLFSWIESCVSDTHRYIDNKMELTRCRMYVRRMRMTVPKLRWTIDCYHWGSEDTEVRSTRCVNHRYTASPPGPYAAFPKEGNSGILLDFLNIPYGAFGPRRRGGGGQTQEPPSPLWVWAWPCFFGQLGGHLQN